MTMLPKTMKRPAFLYFLDKQQMCKKSDKTKALRFGCSVLKNLKEVWAWVAN